MQFDYAVIGGGVVGLSLAYGLLKRGKQVVCLDGSDGDFRASRGNFGLVWVQSKGLNAPHYAQWTQHAVRQYQDFVSKLVSESGVEVTYKKTGGYEYFLEKEAMQERAEQYQHLKTQLNGDYPFEIFDRDRIKHEEPVIGPKVVGASFYPDDGHLNPLQLLHALSAACNKLPFTHMTGERVVDVSKAQHFTLKTEKGTQVHAKNVVLAGGLGAKHLGPQLGFKALVQPQRGQVLVTEKLAPLLKRPSLRIRQVNEGGFQLGDSKEMVGLNDHESVDVIASIAQHAVSVMPFLADVRLVRTWGALRVMSPDGLPIYQKSPRYEGASLVTCHSGITLAAAHANDLIDWLENKPTYNLDKFGESRFD